MRQRMLSFRLILIQRLVFSNVSKNQNSHFSSFCSMGDQIWEKNVENFTTPFLPENIPSPHHLTLEWPEGAAVDPLSL